MLNVFNSTPVSTKETKEVNPTRLTVGRVAIQATKDGTNFDCLTLIIDRKLTINKPLKGIIDIVKAGVFSVEVTQHAIEAVNTFVTNNKAKFTL